nr:RNA-binding protein [Solirubrobacterales bacterium]
AHDIRVVTSDGWLSDQVRAAGASVEPAQGFRNEIDPA